MKLGLFIRLLLIALILSVCLCGCQGVEVEQTAIATGVAADWDDGDYIVSVQLAKVATAEQAASQEGPQFIVLNERGQTLTEAARRLNLTLPRLPRWYHANTLLLGENLAQQGLSDIIDFLSRNPNVRTNSLLVMTRGATPLEVYQLDTPLEPFSAVAIRNILENQEDQVGIYKPVILADFLYNVATPGIDPVIPQVRIISDHGKKFLTIAGTAVFRGTEWAGELNEAESRGFRFLSSERIRGGLLVVPAPGDENRHITIELISSQATMKPVWKEGELRMMVQITADGNFYDQTSSKTLLDLETFRLMEQLSADQIEQDIKRAIGKAQGYQADIFGWGRLLEREYPHIWSQVAQDWPEVFSALPADIQITFKLRRTYLTDKSFVIK